MSPIYCPECGQATRPVQDLKKGTTVYPAEEHSVCDRCHLHFALRRCDGRARIFAGPTAADVLARTLGEATP